MADGFRILENGDLRITQSSDSRITENFIEAFSSVSASSSVSFAGLVTRPGAADFQVLGSKLSSGERTLFGHYDNEAVGTITNVVRMDWSGYVDLLATGTLAPLGTGRSQADTSLTASSSKNFYVNTTSLEFSELVAEGTLDNVPLLIQYPEVDLLAEGTADAVGARRQIAESSLSTLGSKLTIGTRVQYGFSSLAATGSKAAAGIKILFGNITSGTDEVTRITESGDIRVLENGTDTRTAIAAYGNIIFATIVGNPSKTFFSSQPYYKDAGTWKTFIPNVEWNGAWTQNLKIYKHTNGAWKRSY